MHEFADPPAVPNPFTPDFGTRPAHLATGQELLGKAIRSLASGPRDSGYTRLILGQRGSGKTTILAEIRELARAAGMLALSTDAATSGLPDRIASAIDRARDTARDFWSPPEGTTGRLRLSGFQIGPFGANWEKMPVPQQQWSLGRRLEALAAWASEQGSAILLTVDELHAADREEARRLAADIQSITKIDGFALAFVGAGLPEMADTVLADRKMTFFHRCHRDRMPHTDYDGAWRCLRLTTRRRRRIGRPRNPGPHGFRRIRSHPLQTPEHRLPHLGARGSTRAGHRPVSSPRRHQTGRSRHIREGPQTHVG